MPSALDALIEKARGVKMSPEQREEQRRSFAYGNSKIENQRITRSSIDQEAQKLDQEKDGKEDN
jgi:hypothetical protein